MEPIDGGTWDMSRLDAKLWLGFTSSTTGWGATGSLYDPQVSLCGDTITQLVHYRPFNYDGLIDGTSSGSVGNCTETVVTGAAGSAAMQSGAAAASAAAVRMCFIAMPCSWTT